MRCLYCNYEAVCNATKMTYHIAKKRGGDIRPCPGTISQKYLLQNRDLLDRVLAKANARRQAVVEEDNHQRMMIDDAVGGSSAVSTAASSAGSKRAAGEAPGFKRRACNPDDGSLKPRAQKGPVNYKQPQLVVSRQVSAKGARARMDTCVARYIHANGLPPRLSECPTFRVMLDEMRFQAADYKPPNRMLVAGELLERAYRAVDDQQVAKLKEEAEKYGLALNGVS